MTVDLELPSLGEGVESADVAEILVKEGDVVEVDQPILELETEKAVMEVPSPHAGTVRRVLIAEGETIRVGQKLLSIETTAVVEAASVSRPAAPASAPPAAAAPMPASAAPSAAAASAPASGAKGAGHNGSGATKPPAPPSPALAAPAPAPPAPAKSAAPATRGAAAPAAAETLGAVVEFTLPNLGEGVASADVAEVLVKAGDQIAANQPVLELETEKAVMEVPCPHAGQIETVLVQPGDKVQVGQAMLRVRTSGGAAAPGQPIAPAPAKSSAAPPSAPSHGAASSASPARASSSSTASSSTTAASSTPAAPSSARPAAVAAPMTTALTKPSPAGAPSPAPAAPSTRRLARKLGVDLRTVGGSGPGGRITADDVQGYVRQQLAQRQVPAVARPAAGALAAGSLAPPPLPDFSRFGLVERQSLNKIARTAAENLTVSWNVIPHVTQHDRTDITDLEAARKRFTQGWGKNGPKVTMTAIAIKALATCLQAFPKFNSSLDPETHELVLKRYYHIGCAVDTPHGLLVPVVKDCDKKSILEIAASITELAEKARDRKLSMDDMQGATCTVTNLGGIGGVAFTPIVNYPEVCILGMARSQTELQLVNGQVQERLMLPLALSYDHRVINGADAARFVAALCQMLSDPFQLLSAI